jgi:transcriptional regulator with XRE-family HTH domain
MRSVHTDEYKAVLNVIVSVRKRAGVTQQQLADRLKKPQSFVSKYESGERRIDVAEFLVVLRELGADPQATLGEILAAPAFAAREPRRRRAPRT